MEKGPTLQWAVNELRKFDVPSLTLPKDKWDQLHEELSAYQSSFNPPGDVYVYPMKMSDGSIKQTPKRVPHWWNGKKFLHLKGKPVYLEGSENG